MSKYAISLVMLLWEFVNFTNFDEQNWDGRGARGGGGVEGGLAGGGGGSLEHVGETRGVVGMEVCVWGAGTGLGGGGELIVFRGLLLLLFNAVNLDFRKKILKQEATRAVIS